MLRKRFTLGQGLRRERLVWPKLWSGEEGRRMGKRKRPPWAGTKGANGNERASPKARESRSGTKNFPAEKSLAVLGWDSVNLCGRVGVGNRLASVPVQSSPPSTRVP